VGAHFRSAKVDSIEEGRFTLVADGADIVCTTTHACKYLNAKFSVGTCDGDPDGDNVFLMIEKTGATEEESEATIRLMRTDEMAVLASLCSAVTASVLCDELPEGCDSDNDTDDCNGAVKG
jgi:hypothetical protein